MRVGEWLDGRGILPGRAMAALGLLLLVASPAQAQLADELERALSTPSTVIERFTPPPKRGTVTIEVQDKRRLVPEAEARKILFTLRSVTVEGAVTVPPEALAAVWSDKLGTRISLADLYGVADAVEAAYRKAGYFAAAVVPEHDVSSGNVRIVVYESYLREITVRSNVPGLERRLAPYIDRLTSMRPIHIKTAERQLLLMSDLAGLAVNGLFKRPEGASGGGSLDLEITFTRASGRVALDNLGDDTAGPVELSGQVTFNDVFGMFESTSVVGMTIPDAPEELMFFQLSQDVPIGTRGVHAGYLLTRLTSKPDDVVDIDIGVTQVSVFASYPVLRTIDRSLFAEVGFETRDTNLDIMGNPILRSSARWMSASLNAEQSLWRGVAKLGASFGQGVDGLGSNDRDDVLSGRPGVPADYRFVSGTLDVSQSLWQRASLRLRGAGQYAFDPLPQAAQLHLGGDPYGQAFDGAALSGDSGIAGTVEINQGVDLRVDWLGRTALFAFADYGKLWNRDVAIDYTEASLGSAGFGLRALVADHLRGQLMLAVPWEADAVDDPGTRVFFRLAAEF
ncbi:hemolysin activation/secretion protein [Amorphus suaedae]